MFNNICPSILKLSQCVKKPHEPLFKIFLNSCNVSKSSIYTINDSPEPDAMAGNDEFYTEKYKAIIITKDSIKDVPPEGRFPPLDLLFSYRKFGGCFHAENKTSTWGNTN